MHSGTNDSGEECSEKSPVLIGTFFLLSVKGTPIVWPSVASAQRLLVWAFDVLSFFSKLA